MPPKPKLYKNTNKSASIQNVAFTSEPCQSNADQLVNDQFEIELSWCIQQLQIAIKNTNLTNRQVQDHTKSLNTLMSNKTPLVQKRQVMRLSFGDYRTKMALEEKKAAKISMKMVSGKPNSKSMFVKKAVNSCGENDFRFNFQSQECRDILDHNLDNNLSKPEELTSVNRKFKPSDNNFRFNFDSVTA
ncbi:UPF0488 protein CG14286 isoform X2 [Cylas formicarius]|uniref:UPF0488 protein CG14286 isoform X2 n=1 Tax=Cylas formicarius TaxID=197179 RepID=UPI002958BD1D|nr:UPF0488 protein CG14286 isoform X2 [Cylas formicarius]